MKTLLGENKILLRGRLAQLPRFSHESHGVKYDTFPLLVTRLSGTDDQLNILVPHAALESSSNDAFEPMLSVLRIGDTLEISGEVRSFNNRSGVGSRLVISVLARTLTFSEAPHANELTLSGTLCKPPNHRKTPLGRDICDLLLAVNRRYGRADYLPCIAWGSLAVSCGELEVGASLCLEGRLQSRIYYKDLDGIRVPHTAFEVSIMSMSVEES